MTEALSLHSRYFCCCCCCCRRDGSRRAPYLPTIDGYTWRPRWQSLFANLSKSAFHCATYTAESECVAQTEQEEHM